MEDNAGDIHMCNEARMGHGYCKPTFYGAILYTVPSLIAVLFIYTGVVDMYGREIVMAIG